MENNEKNALSITELYFELSNTGDLPTIKTLFIPDATYSSANTGLYYGRIEIMKMMDTFFNSYKSLNWEINSITALNKYIVEVNFTCSSIDMSDQAIKRTGVERIVVVEGLIRHIEVR